MISASDPLPSYSLTRIYFFAACYAIAPAIAFLYLIAPVGGYVILYSFIAEGFYHKVSGSPLCSCSMVGSPTSVMSSHALGMVSNGAYSFTENL